MFEGILLLLLALAIGTSMHLFVKERRIHNVLQSALDKADMDRTEFAKIPVNQLILLGFNSRYEIFRTSKEFNHTMQVRHPAVMSAARRRKL